VKRSYGVHAALIAAFVVATSLMSVASASAETVITPCQGTCGSYQVDDNNTGQPGATCRYTQPAYYLAAIDIRPPLMHGNYASKTKVEWRYRIQRESTDLTGWKLFYESTFQSAMADNQIPAYKGHGFQYRTWNAPADPTGYLYRVRIVMRWWHNGAVEGSMAVEYDWYQSRKSATEHRLDTDRCLSSY
jgi:hypothetical protein